MIQRQNKSRLKHVERKRVSSKYSYVGPPRFDRDSARLRKVLLTGLEDQRVRNLDIARVAHGFNAVGRTDEWTQG